MFKAILALLVVLAAVGGGGYYNYQRNAHLVADVEGSRPYKTLSDADFKQLLAAYEGELKRLKQGVAGSPGEASQVEAYDSSDVGGKAEGFAQYQRQNEHWKRERGRVMEEEHMLKELRREKQIRDRHLDDEWARIWLRVSTF
jgi:hypothetical protein